MSKKINISIPNKIRPNLGLLFHEYLSNKNDELDRYEYNDDYMGMAEYWDTIFPGWDDAIDEGEVVFPFSVRRNKSKKNKHKRGRGKSKAKLIDINVPYSGEEDDYDFDDILDFTKDGSMDEMKEIWFYSDYHDKEDRLEFNNLGDFKDFCVGMGYYIPKEVIDDISWRYESHCCLCPQSEKIGLLQVLSGHSYGSMFYDACEEDEL